MIISMKPRFKNKDTPKKVEKLLRKAVKEVHQKLADLGINADGFRASVYVDDARNRPSIQNEWGVAAAVYDDNRFKIVIDRDRIDDPQVLNYFKAFVVHEANHLELMKLKGDPQTLADVLVSEGFAQVNEREAGFPKILDEGFLDAEKMENFIGEVKLHLEDDLFAKKRPKKDYDYWFDGKTALTRFFNKGSGYALGLHIVKGFMNDNNLSMKQAMQEPTEKIIGHWLNPKV